MVRLERVVPGEPHVVHRGQVVRERLGCGVARDETVDEDASDVEGVSRVDTRVLPPPRLVVRDERRGALCVGLRDVATRARRDRTVAGRAGVLGERRGEGSVATHEGHVAETLLGHLRAQWSGLGVVAAVEQRGAVRLLDLRDERREVLGLAGASAGDSAEVGGHVDVLLPERVDDDLPEPLAVRRVVRQDERAVRLEDLGDVVRAGGSLGVVVPVGPEPVGPAVRRQGRVRSRPRDEGKASLVEDRTRGRGLTREVRAEDPDDARVGDHLPRHRGALGRGPLGVLLDDLDLDGEVAELAGIGLVDRQGCALIAGNDRLRGGACQGPHERQLDGVLGSARRTTTRAGVVVVATARRRDDQEYGDCGEDSE